MLSFLLAWTIWWTNSRVASDFICHDAHVTSLYWMPPLTHWGRVTHICISKLTTFGSVNGLSPGRRQAIIRTSARILWIGPLGSNFSENLIGIQTFSFKKMTLKMSSAKWRPFCLGLNVLRGFGLYNVQCWRQSFGRPLCFSAWHR